MITSRAYIRIFCLLLIFLFAAGLSHAQDSALAITGKQAARYARTIDAKADALNRSIEKGTMKSLNKMLQREKKMRSRLARINPALSKSLFNYSIDSLKKLQWAMKHPEKFRGSKLTGKYFPYLDTMKNAVGFLKSVKTTFRFKPTAANNDTPVTDPAEGIESRLAVVHQIDQYMADRQNVLRDHLKPFPSLYKEVTKFQKDVYYYRAKMDEFKSIFSDQSKIEKVITGALAKLPVFQQYFGEHSDLASIFSLRNVLPASGNSIPVVNGIAPRLAVQQAVATNAPASNINLHSLITQQLDQAETLKDKLKNKLKNVGGMKDKEIPEFRPNTQKVKSFWKRLEYSTDLQTAKSNNLFPATGNLGVLIGYKMNDKSSAGIGAAYRFGLGHGWKSIQLSHQGVGLRSYINWKLKGKFYIQGGSEWNYNKEFEVLDQLKVKSMWQHSALLGLNKKYQLTKKIKGNMQVLYDFLYYQHKPTTSPVLFRLGYGL